MISRKENELSNYTNNAIVQYFLVDDGVDFIVKPLHPVNRVRRLSRILERAESG